MTNLHDITSAFAQVYGFDPVDTSDNGAGLTGQLLVTLMERLVARSYSYLGVDDQRILDDMLDADAEPDAVIGFLSQRIPVFAQVVMEIITEMKNSIDEVEKIAESVV